MSVDACKVAIRDHDVNTGHELDPNNIRLMNWNIQKGTAQTWKVDYDSLAMQKDLVLFRIAAGVSILIGCVGLFGLMSFMANQRTKEIGVRREALARANAAEQESLNEK